MVYLYWKLAKDLLSLSIQPSLSRLEADSYWRCLILSLYHWGLFWCQKVMGSIVGRWCRSMRRIQFRWLAALLRPSAPNLWSITTAEANYNCGMFHLKMTILESSLQAGLWEMPLQLVESNCSKEQREEVMTLYLNKVLDLHLADKKILNRRYLGQIVHVFSHIRLTVQVEIMSLLVSCIKAQSIFVSP